VNYHNQVKKGIFSCKNISIYVPKWRDFYNPYSTYVNKVISAPRDTKNSLSLSAPVASTKPWDPGVQDWLLSVRRSEASNGGESSKISSIPLILFLKHNTSLLMLPFRAETSVTILRIRIGAPDPHHNAAGKWQAGHLLLCSSVDEKKGVSVSHESEILRL